jgi:hypothetical protein
MRLDATTDEVVSFLRNNGLLVHFPIDARETDDSVSVKLEGGHTAIVRQNDARRFYVSLIPQQTPEMERLSYCELLAVSDALKQQYERLHELRYVAIRTPEQGRHRATGKYADDLNNLAFLHAKVSRIIAAERKAQYADKEICDSI